MSYIFSFSSRNGALRFYDAVRANGIAATLVNTPISGSGCGLSVKTTDYDGCKGVLMRGSFSSFTSAYMFDGQKYITIFDD